MAPLFLTCLKETFHRYFCCPYSTENVEQMHSPSAGDLHTEILMIIKTALYSSPTFFFSRRKNSVSMQSCQHHEWCYKPEGMKAIKGAVWNTYICNAITCFMASGRRDAGLAGGLHEVTSLSVTQPRVVVSFKLKTS